MKLWIVSFCIFSFCGCFNANQISYSYRVNTYTIDSSNRLYFFDELISHGEYLIEFQKRVNFERSITLASDSTVASYDTVGVILLSAKTHLFYQFDTFAVSNKLLSVGLIANKPGGTRLNFSKNSPVSNGSFTTVNPIKLHGVDYFVSEVVGDDKNRRDSIKQEILLFKNRNFNSLFKINGVKFPDSEYCIVGFRITDLKTKQIFLKTPVSLRTLTAEEQKICRSMVEASKKARTDTIQKIGYSVK